MNDQNLLFRSQDSFQNVMEYYSQLGFQKKTIWEAWKNTNHRQNLMLEELIRLTTETGEITQIEPLETKLSKNKFDSQLMQAINLSLKTVVDSNTEDYIRKQNNPVGLVNLGRTCYFNVVIQTLFSIKEVRDLIFSINLNQQENQERSSDVQLTNDGQNQNQIEREKFVNMTKQFQILFASLLQGQKSHQNPRDLFNSLKALNGECFKIGEENDFWEFQNSTFELLEKSFSKLQNITESEIKTHQINSQFLSKLMPLSIKNDFFNDQYESEKKKQQQSQEQNYNPLTQLFFGKIQECITYNEGQNELKKYNEYASGIVSLEVKHGDLYKALEASQIFEILDYEVSEGIKTRARVENKFKKAPQILNFNINRLDFDRKNLCTVKLNNQFYFEKELNLETFCVSDEILEGNLSREDINNLEKINRQIQKIEEKLNQCQNPDYAPIQLDSCFQNIISFLKKQQSNSDDFIDIDEYEMELEKADGQFGLLGSKHEILTTMKILTNYKEQICKQTESLNQKLEKLRKERYQIYKKTKKNIYELFSILMHDGTAETGHYYCYIWDELSNKWYKYNDSTVTEAVEEDLLIEAFGKPNSTKNACCLFYRNKLCKTDYSKQSEISPQLQELVNTKNKQFFDEIDQQKVLNSLEPFKRKLNQELALRQSLIQKNQDTLQCINELVSFENFLLNLEQFKHYGIREVLVNMIKELDYSIIKSQLKDHSNLDKGIELFFQQLEKTYNLPSYLSMKESQISELQTLKESHQTLLKLVKEFQAILQNFEKIEFYPSVIKSLSAILLALKDLNPLIVKNSLLGLRLNQAVNYMLQVQLLKGCFNIECTIQKQDSKDLVSTTHVMILALMAFYMNQEQLKKQISLNFQYALNTIGSYPQVFSTQIYKDFKQSIEQIPKLDQLYEKNVTNLRNVFTLKYSSENMNYDSNDEMKQVTKQLLKDWDKQLNLLQLWRQFFDRLNSGKKLISTAERLDQEELLYAQYM